MAQANGGGSKRAAGQHNDLRAGVRASKQMRTGWLGHDGGLTQDWSKHGRVAEGSTHNDNAKQVEMGGTGGGEE